MLRTYTSLWYNITVLSNFKGTISIKMEDYRLEFCKYGHLQPLKTAYTVRYDN